MTQLNVDTYGVQPLDPLNPQREIGALILDRKAVIWGRFSQPTENGLIFELDEPERVLPTVLGAELEYLDSYWAERAEVVLLEEGWQRQRFVAGDAVAEKADGVLMLRPAQAGEQGALIGAWDHEHCAICWAKIEPGDSGWLSRSGTWVCEDCYKSFVSRRSLNFPFDDN